ncbi:TRAP-type C4-dicarboxylate transport system substrate-binding protein [Desulfobaculum xiamenense]|uniref:TRAP-type C4-dicarboxylate transport system substrate-binding protein n=1 Tax=Desulfobaculum xiamenense TaxID=995050 RepID=A0A846QJC8_9BACT|nr:TRAP transporter substrate-binding protein DctP [Desulfobaculum xiamenense]NJB67170.1 TRAP-type C4-dicarboxylate transport system substrate-binding protein [Desulfobaculum xiamenense]
MRSSRPVLALLALFVMIACASATHAAQTIKIATAAPEGSEWMNTMRAAAEAITRQTDGRVAFKFYGGGVMGNEKSVLRKIRIGQLQGGMFTLGQLADVCPDLNLYGLPLTYRSDDEIDHVRAKFDAVLLKALADAGFVSFGFASGGAAMLMGDAPITHFEAIKGRKVWIPEGDRMGYAVMEALGIAPVTLPITDVLTGLQAGLLDIVAAPPSGAIILQWHTRVRAITNTPITFTFGTMAIDARIFSKLNEADQKTLEDVFGTVMRNFDISNRKDNQDAANALVAQGLTFVEPNAEDLEWARGVARSVTDRLADEGLFDRTHYLEIQSLLDALRAPATP